MSESILAWHFSDGELRFDYAGVKVEAGLVLETEEKPVVGRKGFHASEKAIDALNWFSTSPSKKIVVSRVRLSGEIVKSTQSSSYGERLSAQRREHLWAADANDSVEDYVLWAYQQVLKRLRERKIPLDNRLEDILNMRKRWRAGELSTEERQAITKIILVKFS